jgi:hypothetical protein
MTRVGLGFLVAASVPGLSVAGTPVATAPNPNAVADYAAVQNLKPGEWYEVQNSRLSLLDPCPSKTCVYNDPSHTNGTGQPAVMSAWSGGAYDWVHDIFLVHGGGHYDYAGNEVYAFDVKAMRWERLTNPSLPILGNPLWDNALWWPDGTPNSAHTYDNLEYVPGLNALCEFAIGSRWSIGSGGPITACFDMSSYSWRAKRNVPQGAIGAKTAYDPVTDSVWRQGAGGGSYLHRYDSVQDLWQNYGNINTEPSGWISYNTTGAVDPKRRLFVAVGGGEVRAWDMTKNPTPGVQTTTFGDTAIVGRMNPGLEYDQVIDKLVAWAGGVDVYTLDTNTWVWKRVLPAATNTVVPTNQQAHGTYGRFRYVPSLNVYIAVNQTRENVYFYKMSAGNGGPSPLPSAPKSPTGLRVR